MRRMGLERIYYRLERRCNQLIHWLDVWPYQGQRNEIAIEIIRPAFLANRLQLLWGEFCCELIVRSAMGQCHTRTGNPVSRILGVKKVSDIAAVAGKPLAGIGAKWEEPSYAIDFSAKLGIANRSEVSAGLAAADLSNLEDLRILRNYVIHPNRRTGQIYATMVQRYGLAGTRPDGFMRHKSAGGTIWEIWIGNLLDAAWNAVE